MPYDDEHATYVYGEQASERAATVCVRCETDPKQNTPSTGPPTRPSTDIANWRIVAPVSDNVIANAIVTRPVQHKLFVGTHSSSQIKH
ncbi:unnamed protein product [Sphagnum balticum]